MAAVLRSSQNNIACGAGTCQSDQARSNSILDDGSGTASFARVRIGDSGLTGALLTRAVTRVTLIFCHQNGMNRFFLMNFFI